MPNGYPTNPPKFIFDPINGEALIHLNVFSSGDLCIPVLSKYWNKNASMYEILFAIRHILHIPNEADPANESLRSPKTKAVYKLFLKKKHRVHKLNRNNK